MLFRKEPRLAQSCLAHAESPTKPGSRELLLKRWCEDLLIDSNDLNFVSGIQSHSTTSVATVSATKRNFGPEEERARKTVVISAVRKFVYCSCCADVAI
jgi:hypothetical protein